jgi:hypothetical protein
MIPLWGMKWGVACTVPRVRQPPAVAQKPRDTLTPTLQTTGDRGE